MDNENYNQEGDDAPLTASNTRNVEEPYGLSLEEQGFEVMDEEHGIDDDDEVDSESLSDDEEINAIKKAIEDATDNILGEGSTQNSEKIKFNLAARKRFRYFLSMGMSLEDAKASAVLPVGSTSAHSSKSFQPTPKKGQTGQGIRVCIVPDNFPDESLTEKQSKSVQEAIMDQILEMGNASTIKPKFNSSCHQTNMLAIMCADETTVEWLKTVAPTLRPWENAALKALKGSEIPHPWEFLGFLPDSVGYSDEKIIKLFEAQNDQYNFSTWKVLKREVVGTELEVTFSIERSHTRELKLNDYKVNYKFGHIQLWPKVRSKPGESDESCFQPPRKPKVFRGTYRPPRRFTRIRGSSHWRGSKHDRGSRPSRGGISKGYRGSRPSRSHRPSNSWEGPSTSREQEQKAWHSSDYSWNSRDN